MKTVTVISSVLSILVVMPIWYYLLYQILSATQATQLEWFLFWVYVPVGLLMSILKKMVESAK